MYAGCSHPYSIQEVCCYRSLCCLLLQVLLEQPDIFCMLYQPPGEHGKPIVWCSRLFTFLYVSGGRKGCGISTSTTFNAFEFSGHILDPLKEGKGSTVQVYYGFESKSCNHYNCTSIYLTLRFLDATLAYSSALSPTTNKR